MKIGIFSDIHGNRYAFDVVWKELIDESCDVYVFAGDICGYYYQQPEIIEILEAEKRLIAVAGNHDRLFINMLYDEGLQQEYDSKYGNSCRLLKERILPRHLEYLKDLCDQRTIPEEGILICHGSPIDRLNGYVYPDTPLDGIDGLEYRTIILGHTHYPMDRIAGSVRIINPGSAGQPRDCSSPSWATYDTKTGKCEFRRISYDKSRLLAEIDGYNEKNPYLKDVLTRVRGKLK